MESIELLKKYNIPVPRYTSYPTVPYWKSGIDKISWAKHLNARYEKSGNEICLYIHLPFCESLCTYCGCNKVITKKHSVEAEYIDAILKEWQLYLAVLGKKPTVKELHLGGGTPTFFSAENLKKMLCTILSACIIAADAEFSFEGHPNNTTREHLQTLYQLGFTRVSYGVQDNDLTVQKMINRIQPVSNVAKVTEDAKDIGYKSVNFDLIYGLPGQTRESISNTVKQAISLMPDRIAFYSYAHVPWASRGQRLFDESDLPTADEKLALYATGKNIFTACGYYDIGMDHFALPTDSLYKASKQHKLFRNFMGYTTHASAISIGLGLSAISDTGTAYAQNEKTLHNYYEEIASGILAVTKGYFLSEGDVIMKKYILDIICNRRTIFDPSHLPLLYPYTWPVLAGLAKDGLINYDERTLQVTDKGAQFIRNICSAFDQHLQANNMREKAFSKAV